MAQISKIFVWILLLKRGSSAIFIKLLLETTCEFMKTNYVKSFIRSRDINNWRFLLWRHLETLTIEGFYCDVISGKKPIWLYKTHVYVCLYEAFYWVDKETLEGGGGWMGGNGHICMDPFRTLVIQKMENNCDAWGFSLKREVRAIGSKREGV